MPRIVIEKWPVTGLAKGSLNGRPFALDVGREIEVSPEIYGVLKETSGVKVRRIPDPPEPAEKPGPVTVLHPEEEQPKEPDPAPEPDADPPTDDPPADDGKADAEADTAPKPKAQRKTAAKKTAAKK